MARVVAMAWVLGGIACQNRPTEPANVVLVVLDTTRVDRLGCYGQSRPTTPYLDRLARDGVMMREAWSTSSWTLPAVASLLTGQYPTSHGAHFDAQGTVEIAWAARDDVSRQKFRANPLDAAAVTLPAVLAKHGWATAGFAAGPWLARPFGLNAGFSHYDDDGIATINGRPAHQVTSRALAWLDGKGEKPFFVLLNYFEPHWPYRPSGRALASVVVPGDDLADADGMTRLRYAAEIRAMDNEVGRLVADLKRRGLYNNTWIVVVGDHGELLGEHGTWGHGEHLTEEEVHVPLILKPPRGRRAPVRGDEPVQLVDIAPTLLTALGVPVPASMQGGALPRPGHPVYAELFEVPGADSEGAWRLLVEGRWVYVWNSAGRSMLVERGRGAVARDSEHARAMAARLDAFVGSLPVAEPPTDANAELRSLHYVP
jgi:arylsulfatase A-like enzyme